MILHGDLFERLKEFPDDSFDAGVTDPPYGIGFMGKLWDTFTPETVRKSAESGMMPHPLVSENPNLRGRKRAPAISPSQIEYDRTLTGQQGFQEWTRLWGSEVYRVLKPGAYLVVNGAPRSFHRMTCGLEDAGFEIRDCLSWLFGQGFPKSLNLGDGRGTALKPAWEPIILARKPVKGSVTANLVKHGTGSLNVDACRLENAPPPEYREQLQRLQVQRGNADAEVSDAGRWPANVILDEDAAQMLDADVGELTSGANPNRRGSAKFRNAYGEFAGQTECEPARGLDVGGPSRFFYCAKPSREERDAGCEHLLTRQRDDSRKVGKPGGDNPRNRGLQPRGNYHPTVKPVDLMRWLVRLVTPPNGRVLDPFAGSGTTGIACRYEMREFVGIEREAEYVTIAEARIAGAAPLLAEMLQSPPSQAGTSSQAVLFSDE